MTDLRRRLFLLSKKEEEEEQAEQTQQGENTEEVEHDQSHNLDLWEQTISESRRCLQAQQSRSGHHDLICGCLIIIILSTEVRFEELNLSSSGEACRYKVTGGEGLAELEWVSYIGES